MTWTTPQKLRQLPGSDGQTIIHSQNIDQLNNHLLIGEFGCCLTLKKNISPAECGSPNL